MAIEASDGQHTGKDQDDHGPTQSVETADVRVRARAQSDPTRMGQLLSLGKLTRQFTQVDSYVRERLALYDSKKRGRQGRRSGASAYSPHSKAWVCAFSWDDPVWHCSDSGPVNTVGEPDEGKLQARFDGGLAKVYSPWLGDLSADRKPRRPRASLSRWPNQSPTLLRGPVDPSRLPTSPHPRRRLRVASEQSIKPIKGRTTDNYPAP